MNDLDSLLAAIIANPAEDTPRLMYADEVQARGDEARAEFIRVQCELASAGGPRCSRRTGAPCYARGQDVALCPGCERRTYCLRRERELLDEYRGEWTPFVDGNKAGWIGAFAGMYEGAPDVGEMVTGGGLRFRFRRGFVVSVRCTSADWLRHGDDIRRKHPVTTVTLTTYPGHYHRTQAGGRWFDLWIIPPEWDSVNEAGESVLFSERDQKLKWYLSERWRGVTFEFDIATDASAAELMAGAFNTASYGFQAGDDSEAVNPHRVWARLDAETEIEVPGEGWQAEVRRNQFQAESLRGARYRREGLIEVELRLETSEQPDPRLFSASGATLSPIVAADSAGRRCRVPASILYSLETDLSHREAVYVYVARATSEVEYLTGGVAASQP